MSQASGVRPNESRDEPIGEVTLASVEQEDAVRDLCRSIHSVSFYADTGITQVDITRKWYAAMAKTRKD